MTRITPAALARWRRDPIVFVREALIDPETGQPFERHKVPDGAERYLQVLFLWTGNSSSVQAIEAAAKHNPITRLPVQSLRLASAPLRRPRRPVA
jgi:hypothetical protein